MNIHFEPSHEEKYETLSAKWGRTGEYIISEIMKWGGKWLEFRNLVYVAVEPYWHAMWYLRGI